jgi:hypothetical protein
MIIYHPVFSVLKLNSLYFVKNNFSRKGAMIAKVIYRVKLGVLARDHFGSGPSGSPVLSAVIWMICAV